MTKKSQVKKTAWELLENKGKIPTVREMQDAINGGSLRDIAKEMKEWQQELANTIYEYRHRPEMPDDVWKGMLELWDAALKDGRKLAKEEYSIKRAEAERIKAKAQADLNDALKKQENAETAYRQVTQKHDELTAALKNMTDEKNACSRELSAAQKQIEFNKVQHEELKTDLKRRAEEHRKSLEALRADHELSIKQLQSQHNKERKQLVSQIGAITQSAYETQVKLDKLQSESEILRDKLTRTETEFKTAQIKISELQRDIIATGKSLDHTNLEHKKEVNSISEQLEKCQRALTEEKSLLSSTQQTLQVYQDRAEIAERKAHEAIEQKSRLEGKLEALEDQLKLKGRK